MIRTYTQQELIDIKDECESIMKQKGITDKEILLPLKSAIWIDKKSPLTKEQIEWAQKIAKEIEK